MTTPKNNWEPVFRETFKEVWSSKHREFIRIPDGIKGNMISFIRSVEARAREYGYKACMENVRKFHEENKPKLLKSINK